ncbi:unnamed protein product [Kuraishia capsulata CBS 1993]|uniref:Dihydrodipicolinate synthase n=1 Tax=Kuraishia capsulata CBS 1993 TaxID=1382522 RepID=W6MFU8_9ASCO|nr:uncharacterized protein KUCA_T00000776001 [Kuraishia capsulata CBS 1993]CDK24809.1 unnamed protein product [Kuraishia capsulata CBS 1993]
MTVQLPPKGIYSPIPTFFKKDYSIDYESILKHVRYLYQAKVTGILIGGSTGEAINLTREERHEIIRRVRSEFPDPSFKVMGGAIGSCIPDLLDDIQGLKSLKVDYAVVLVPGYYGPGLTKQQGLVNFFQTVADSSKLPLLIYNYPGVQNNIDLTIESYIKLAKHPNIVGCKLTHYNFTLYTLICQNEEIKSANFRPLAGVGQVLVPALATGIEGCIDGLSNVFPKSMLKVFNDYGKGDTVQAAKFQELVTTVNEMTAVLNLLGLKFALNHILGIGEVLHGRPPIDQDIDESVWEKYLPAFEKLWAIEKGL